MEVQASKRWHWRGGSVVKNTRYHCQGQFWFPAPRSGGSHLPIIPAPGCFRASGPQWHLHSYSHIDPHIFNSKYIINLFLKVDLDYEPTRIRLPAFQTWGLKRWLYWWEPIAPVTFCLVPTMLCDFMWLYSLNFISAFLIWKIYIYVCIVQLTASFSVVMLKLWLFF